MAPFDIQKEQLIKLSWSKAEVKMRQKQLIVTRGLAPGGVFDRIKMFLVNNMLDIDLLRSSIYFSLHEEIQRLKLKDTEK